MNLNHKTDYQNGDQLTATAWNKLAADVNELGAGGTNSGTNVVSTEIDPTDENKTFVKVNDVLVAELTTKDTKGTNVGLSGNNNINIEPRPASGTGEGKNTPGLANRKGGNIALKPGDDIELCSHKRGTSKNAEVAVKTIDGSDNPVKLQVFAGELTFSTKGKEDTKKKNAAGEDIKTAFMTKSNYQGGIQPVVYSNNKYYLASSNDKNAESTDTEVSAEYVTSAFLYDNSNVLDVNVTTGEGKAYLKIRAQAIDLRCEENGGIALQPKGRDSAQFENKIKFEHGGGDGLEFGTFNTQHTSLYTNDYRFKKDGIIRLATRTTVASDKADENDATTALKYVKAADDFYDNIDANDPVCTWEDIVTYIAWAKTNNQGPWAL